MNTPAQLRPLAVIAVIAATYVFFLLFAEFALLHLMEARAADPAALRFGLAWLGAGGVAGSVVAARFAGRSPSSAITLGFLGCGAAAGLAALRPAILPLEGVAALTGLGLGWLTVNVAGNLHRLLASARLGLATGTGTGLAYAFCNIPAVFASSPIGHAWISAGACALGILASSALPAAAPPAAPPAAPGPRSLFWKLLIAFVALVWLDSAAFLLIQERPELRALTWATDRQLWTNAATHLAAALLGGWLLDRGRLRLVLALAGGGLLTASCALAQGGPAATGLHLLYPMGVSLYSTALVALPALGRGWTGGADTRRRAAWLYVIAGWIGSALGIGMALDQRNIPDSFLLGASAALALVLIGSMRGRAAAAAVLMLAGAATPKAQAADTSAPADAAVIAAGRAVYIAEGCIHCHSQFVRPGTADELYWGPSRPLAELLKEEPPLPGNRRQGPDLQNVGNRRSPDWNRVHLQDPRALAPGSAMPRYAHLFRSHDPRGEALVAYLASLGAATAEGRARLIAGWPPPSALTGDAARGAALFTSLCTGCHGSDARGRGPLAPRLALPPADLVAGPLPRTTRDTPAATAAELARVIRFGLPGTAMAGHETLPDEDIAALTAFVAGLRIPTAPP